VEAAVNEFFLAGALGKPVWMWLAFLGVVAVLPST
jgi:hypothetical protein